MSLAGLCAAAVLIELSLRSAGYLYGRGRLAEPAEPKPAGEVRVLCVGDSFTFGVGAERGASYPDHLQRALDERFPGRARVINAGVPGRNSSQAAAAAPGLIEAHRPDVVLLWIGDNDRHNFTDSQYWLFASGPAFLAKAGAVLQRSRIVKALTWSRGSLAMRRFGATLPSGETAPPLKARGAARREDPRIGPLLERIRRLEFERRTEEGLALALRAIERHPREPRLHSLAGTFYLHHLRDYGKAAEAYENVLALDPGRIEARRELADAYHRSGNLPLAMREIRSLAELVPEDADVRRIALFGFPETDSTAMSELLRYNLTSVWRACRNRGGELMVLTYEYSDWTSDVIRSWARAREVRVIENRRLSASKGNYEDFHAPDDHFNGDGYRLVAENVLEGLTSFFAARGGT